jgi:hypothetical protein
VANAEHNMSRLDELPPDQRAALSLLLRQRKSYAEVAALLGISELAVHDRAHAALAVLAPRRARELTPERRLEVGDYLLGQQPGVAERLRTRTYLSSFEPARAWASEVAAQLASLAGDGLPEIPGAAGGAASGSQAPAGAGAQEPGPQRVGDLSSTPAAAAARPATSTVKPSAGRSPSSSRLGGAVLLVVLVAAVVVAVVLLTGGSGSNKPSASGTVSTASTATKTGPTIDDQITLTAAQHGSGSTGVAYVLSKGSTTAFFIQAQKLPQAKGFYYALWLSNSPTSFLPVTKSSAVGSNHRLEGISPLPSNAGEFHEVLLTRETKAHPASPGTVILRGPFSLH